MLSKNSKLILTGLGLVLILFIAWQIGQAISHRGKTKTTILVVPGDSSLIIDGKKSHPGTVYLTPGSHKLVASRKFFTDDSKTINTKDVSNQPIYMLPKPDSDDAQAYLSEHPEVQAARESAGGAEEQRLRQIELSKYPYLKYLPKETLDYKIDYQTDSQSKPKLTITLFGIINGPGDYARYQQQLKQYKAEALSYLKSSGANPDNLDIQYIPNVN